MVKAYENNYRLAEGSIDLDTWLNAIKPRYQQHEFQLVASSVRLAELAGKEQATSSGQSSLQQGLAIADILADLEVDHQTLAAAIIYPSVQYADLELDDVSEHLGKAVTKLVHGIKRMDAISLLHAKSTKLSSSRIENLRKMLLAMVDDVRIVLIKLAEQLYFLRLSHRHPNIASQILAEETMAIYAPLANRLGVGQLRWELEDLAFRYLEPLQYKELAHLLKLRRIERERYINSTIAIMTRVLDEHEIQDFKITGRAKHIYSIYRKMQRKNVSYDQIFDALAIRILVPTIEDCYVVLSIAHSLWQQIPEEFDDYIALPKQNGYRSLHTVVIGSDNQPIEIQIRTHQMHEESELGVAAHWRYKEGAKTKNKYEAKIAWLRQVLEWQKDLAHQDKKLENLDTQLIEDRVYVFTPNGDVIDLPNGSTALDFAYHIHSDIGHRCRGAKVNGKIIPLTHPLQMGEQIEILTGREANPSRDWLSPHLGYLKSTRAKAKIHHWFKLQDYSKNLAVGKDLIETQMKQLNIKNIELNDIATQLSYKTSDDLLASLGCGDVKLSQILPLVQDKLQHPKNEETPDFITTPPAKQTSQRLSDFSIYGIGNIMSHTARCCKPVPGDQIIGYITLGRGVAVHRQDCVNILHASPYAKQKMLEVSWGKKPTSVYSVSLDISAHDRQNLIRDITSILANEHCHITALNTHSDQHKNLTSINLTTEVNNLEQLSRLIDKIKHLQNVFSVTRKLH